MWPLQVAIFLVATNLVSSQNYQIEIEEGWIKGTTMKTRFGKNFMAFRGIPYAEAPVDDLRFQVRAC